LTRCVEFYNRWEKDPNWCERAKASVSHINNYLQLIHELEATGLPRKLIVSKLPEHLARPIILRKNAAVYESIVQIIKTALMRHEHPLRGQHYIKFTSDSIKRMIANLQSKSPISQTMIGQEWSTGCIRCGEQDIRVLVRHHVLPREIGGENTRTVIVCVKCHSILHSILQPYVDEIKRILKEVA
jgi:hypothetical protein